MNLHWVQTAREWRRVRNLPLTDRGFRYGMAVFETIRIDRGGPRFWPEHLASLRRSGVATGIPVPEIGALPSLLNGSGVLRVQVTAGDGGPADPVERPRVFLTFESRAGNFPHAYCLQSQPAPHRPPPAGLKTHNYWPQCAALLAARSAGADEALLFNQEGLLVSAAMANVFVIDETGALLTPALELDARDGILGRWVSNRRESRPASITRENVRRAKEVFLTNSWLGVMPAITLDGRDLPSTSFASGLRSELQAEYDRIDQ